MKLITAILCVGSFAGFSTPIVYHVDNTHSSVQFTIPFWSVTEVAGRFDRFCGQFLYDESNLPASTIELYIDASSINTSIAMRDRDLVKNYFEVSVFPIITFKSKSVIRKAQKELEAEGQLTLHGVTRQLTITLIILGEVTNEDGSREMGIKLNPLTFDRTLFGITKGKEVSGESIFIGDKVTASGLIRLRDLTQARRDFELKYPEKTVKDTGSFSGRFTNESGEIKINLIAYENNYFLAFQDADWEWLSQAN